MNVDATPVGRESQRRLGWTLEKSTSLVGPVLPKELFAGRAPRVTDHFTGYPAILVRIRDLHKLDRDDLDDLVVEAWLACAGKRVAKAWLAEQETDSTEHLG